MAQWMGQYSGRTHESKVKKIESSLKKAIESLLLIEGPDKKNKEKEVLKLCKKLKSARHKAVKARIDKLSIPSQEHVSKLQALKTSEKSLEEDGLNDILLEFELQNLIEQDQ